MNCNHHRGSFASLVVRSKSGPLVPFLRLVCIPAVGMDEGIQTHILRRVADQLSASAKHVFSANDLLEDLTVLFAALLVLLLSLGQDT